MPNIKRDPIVMGLVATTVEDCRKQLLRARETFRPGFAPQNAHERQVRSDIRNERSRPFEHLLIVNRADIRDGVPVDAVNEVYYALIEANRAYAESLAAGKRERVAPPSLSTLIERENRLQYEGDVLERAILANPNDIDAIDRRILHSVRYRDHDALVNSDLRAHRARLVSA